MSINVEMADTIDDKVIVSLNDACRLVDQDINLEESTCHGNIENLFNEANKELYPSCGEFVFCIDLSCEVDACKST